MDDIIALRRQLHSIAELSGEERETARCIQDFIEETNPDEMITGLGGEGLLASYTSRDSGPEILLRCELDALPIEEDNDFNYRSKNEGAGHKCGHDGHMAILCGVARELGLKERKKGTVHLLFQPAEETGEGARLVLDDKRFTVDADYAFALHNLPGFKKNAIILRHGTFASASEGLIVSLKGKTSHAAHPEQGTSPALAVAELIQSLSAIPQFYTSLEEAAKVTVIHAVLGERAFGTSPGKAKVMSTLRTYDDAVLKKIKDRAMALAKDIASTYELELQSEWVEHFPAVVNTPELSTLIQKVANRNNFTLIEKDTPFGWSEDFGHFTRERRGAMFGVGAGEDHPSLHASTYDFPEDIIQTGIDMYSGIIEELQEGEGITG